MAAGGELVGVLSPMLEVSGVVSVMRGQQYDIYTGEHEVTPSEEEQVLHTRNRAVLTDITVNPIPSNYGRIAWTGTALRVY